VRPSFRFVFAAVFLGTALIVAAFLFHGQRPAVERTQPTAALAKATGNCAECHRRETSAVVHEFDLSKHAKAGLNCLDCHQPAAGQEKNEHHGFVIATALTSKNCAQCHQTEYEQFSRSRHAGPSWAAVNGTAGMSPEQIAQGEKWHPTWVERPANALALMEGDAAIKRGCESCHAIGRPNADGSFGTCTNCHARHVASVRLARLPTTCGQCHMGPDHSQVEIYQESKHGALFAAQSPLMNLDADPKKLTTADMPVPTCTTCHMSGLEGMNVTHDTTERLSWFLFAPVSTLRPSGARGQAAMKELCTKCHAKSKIEAFYTAAEDVLKATNEKVKAAQDVISEFDEFDLWHYYGRTAKHGAFMGGADFVQWHGNYELLRHKNMIDEAAKELRGHGGGKKP
jgi:hydroxylamine dehydrogenase